MSSAAPRQSTKRNTRLKRTKAVAAAVSVTGICATIPRRPTAMGVAAPNPSYALSKPPLGPANARNYVGFSPTSPGKGSTGPSVSPVLRQPSPARTANTGMPSQADTFGSEGREPRSLVSAVIRLFAFKDRFKGLAQRRRGTGRLAGDQAGGATRRSGRRRRNAFRGARRRHGDQPSRHFRAAGRPGATAPWWRLLHNTEKLADPTRFERATSAFGGQIRWFATICRALKRSREIEDIR